MLLECDSTAFAGVFLVPIDKHCRHALHLSYSRIGLRVESAVLNLVLHQLANTLEDLALIEYTLDP